MCEIKRHAQEIFTATLEAFLASPKSGRLTDDLVRQIAAQAIKHAQLFHEQAGPNL